MKITRNRYQQGSIRKVPRSYGFAWEFRYYATEGGRRRLKVQTFDGRRYQTEASVRRAVGPTIPQLNRFEGYRPDLAITFGALLDRYIAEDMPTRKSTRDSYTSLIKNYLRPQWGEMLLEEIRPGMIDAWFKSLSKLTPVSRGHIRAVMRLLFNRAALWEYVPLDRTNPVGLVKIKGVSKRTKEPIVLSYEEFRLIASKLPPHVNVLVLVTACLGLRASEALGLKWSDIDWKKKTVMIQRGAYRGAIEDTKTITSKSKLPLDPTLAVFLEKWREALKVQQRELQGEDAGSAEDVECEWIFANPATGQPYMSPSLQQRWVRPAGESLGIKGLGFHALRHSYRTWLDSVGTSPGVTKDLMRHSTLEQSFDYGRAMSEEKRIANTKVVTALLGPPKGEATE